jgi:diguanylate cyclase (GGDEF)-like protein
MVDIDHFKRVNDTYGHDAGDTVLREVASVLRQSTRSEDLVARYGGEEFIVALPIAASDQATFRAERIRRNLANRRISVSGKPLRITASIGLAFSPATRPRSVESLIVAADLCLYQAKNAGRDRVLCSQKQGTQLLEAPTREDETGCGSVSLVAAGLAALTSHGES